MEQYAYAYILDETYKRVEEIYSLIHKGCKSLKTLLTQTPRQGFEDVDIWCVRIDNILREETKRFRERKDKSIWMYVSSKIRPFPSLNIDVPSIEARILGWICFKNKVEGLLYWCVNWWPKNPFEGADTYKYQNGNGFLYYPGDKILSSLRVKLLREGLEDYEYLYMFEKIANPQNPLFKELQNILKDNGFYLKDLSKLSELKKKIGFFIERRIDEKNI